MPLSPGPPSPVVAPVRDKTLMIRVSVGERSWLHGAARAAGWGKTASWARMVLLEASGSTPPSRSMVSARSSEFAPFRRELARIGSNLNQVARGVNIAVNEGSPVGAEVAHELRRLTRETARLREAIERATDR